MIRIIVLTIAALFLTGCSLFGTERQDTGAEPEAAPAPTEQVLEYPPDLLGEEKRRKAAEL